MSRWWSARSIAVVSGALALSCRGAPPAPEPSDAEPRAGRQPLGPPAAWSLAPDPSSAELEAEIRAFEAQDRAHPPPRDATVFVGSSSFRLWTTLARDFAPHPVINRGFGGSTLRNILDFGRRIVLPYAPARVVLFAGSNDIHAGASATTVLGDFERFVTGVHEVLPRTRIAFVSITTSPSRFSEVTTVRDANRRIREFVARDPRLTYIDVSSLMVDGEGRPRAELYLDDRLHPSRAGYELWIPRIEPFLREDGGAH